MRDRRCGVTLEDLRQQRLAAAAALIQIGEADRQDAADRKMRFHARENMCAEGRHDQKLAFADEHIRIVQRHRLRHMQAILPIEKYSCPSR